MQLTIPVPPGTVFRCPECLRVDHRNCRGRPFCACRICQSQNIMRDAGLRKHDPLVRELLALLLQRNAREYKLARAQPVITTCANPACRRPIPNKPAGRHRRTCSHACRQAVYYLRKKLREQAAQVSPAPDNAA